MYSWEPTTNLHAEKVLCHRAEEAKNFWCCTTDCLFWNVIGGEIFLSRKLMKPEVSAGCHQTLSRRWGLGTRLFWQLRRNCRRLVSWRKTAAVKTNVHTIYALYFFALKTFSGRFISHFCSNFGVLTINLWSQSTCNLELSKSCKQFLAHCTKIISALIYSWMINELL